MSIAVSLSSTAADDPAAPRTTGVRPGHRWGAGLLVAVVALGVAVYLTGGLWRDRYAAAPADNVADQAFFEWALAYGVQVLGHGGNPFYTTMVNWPRGVNLAANTSITVDAVLFAPVTRFAGPQISFLLVLTLNLAGSAFAWYLFLARWVVRHRLAAAVGGLFCGFAPGFVAHANSHLNWTSGWIAPLVLWRLFTLGEARRWAVHGAILGALLAAAFTIAAEGLFLTALAAAVFLLVWAPAKASRPHVRAALPQAIKGLAVAVVVAGLLLAYPLYLHFRGPQTFSATGFAQKYYSEDLASYFHYSDRSLAVTLLPGLHNKLAPNPTEQTSFFGAPLLALMVFSTVLLWRRAAPGRRVTLRALSVIGVTFVVLSLGPRLHWFGKIEHWPLPYALLGRLPLFDAALPLRFALVVAAAFGIVLAMIVEQVLRGRLQPWARAALTAGFAVSLVPLLPTPLPVTQRAPEPDFIAERTWEKYVPDGGVISALPFAIDVAADAQRWQAYTMARGGRQFRIPDGYFLGPETPATAQRLGHRQIRSRIGATPRHTDWLLLRAARYGSIPKITNWDRDEARKDFQYWGVDAVFLPDTLTGSQHLLDHSAVQITATQLLGQPQRVDDVLLWTIRPGVDPLDR